MKNGMPTYRENIDWENNLAKIRVEEGYTLKKLCLRVGCSMVFIQGLQNGMVAPFYESSNRYGQPKPLVLKIARILNASLSDLFPRDVCDIKRWTQLTNNQIIDITHSNRIIDIDSNFLTELITNILYTLSKRERLIIRLRFWPEWTLEEIAVLFNTTRERIRQIEGRALRKLRHPTRTKELLNFY
jgi:transcriptional regulator with XRE-family HTH domain